jgi:hypothetical protein
MVGTVTTADEVLVGVVDLRDPEHVIVHLPSGRVAIPDADVVALELDLDEAA